MTQRSRSPARALAAAALAGGFVVLALVVATSLGGGEEPRSGKRPSGQVTRKSAGGKTMAAAYVVQNGDTLTSIARKTGVPVARIEALNPGVDPQILVSGEKLKLR